MMCQKICQNNVALLGPLEHLSRPRVELNFVAIEPDEGSLHLSVV